MLFVASKILSFFALPSNTVLLLGLAGALLTFTAWKRLGRRLVAASLVLLAILGWSPLGNLLMLPLENRFPPWDPSRGPPDGMVVLGGALDTVVAMTRPEVPLNDAAERMTAAVALARRYPAARIVFSGGTGQLVFRGPPESQLAIRLFTDLGVAPARIAREGASRDTGENAEYSKEVADPRPGDRWLLITSAHHMPRAIGTFRRAGFEVEPYPVDFRTRGTPDLMRPFTSLGDGLRRTDTAMREWVGLLVYWLQGRTSELFPGPQRPSPPVPQMAGGSALPR
jgi:uncharacterized SAM-binding protein YcdF (DUF218 family)